MMEAQSESSKYIYCIVKSEKPLRFALRGIGEREVYTIHFADLAAVVSNTPVPMSCESPHSVTAHRLVVEDVMRDFVVLPVRTGTVVKNADQIVERLLKRRFEEFHGLLSYLVDKVELRLAVFLAREIMFAEILASDARISALRDSLSGPTSKESYHRCIRMAEMVRKAVIRKCKVAGQEILDELRPLVVETKVDKRCSDNEVLNAAFLVQKERKAAVDTKIRELDLTGCGRLKLDYSGSGPPFSFATVMMRRGD